MCGENPCLNNGSCSSASNHTASCRCNKGMFKGHCPPIGKITLTVTIYHNLFTKSWYLSNLFRRDCLNLWISMTIKQFLWETISSMLRGILRTSCTLTLGLTLSPGDHDFFMTGFWGAFCQFEEQPCSSFPCKNGGKCSSFRGELNCKCQNNFTGPDWGKYRLIKKHMNFEVKKVSSDLSLFLKHTFISIQQQHQRFPW